MNGFDIGKIFRRIKAIPKMIQDRNVPWTKKALLIFGIIYLFLPVDLIPPVLFPFGFLDDLVLWIYILLHLGDDLDKYVDYVRDKGDDLSGKYSKKDIVENVTFDVNEDEESAVDEENK